ncbi:amino acid permease [Phenylobacterium sp. VNQ135]|uniref:amino acid permease n=1 Tax=Phenylobacterium sp. VNQ135 TaxID=3400922 RepID=UPI003C0D0BB1
MSPLQHDTPAGVDELAKTLGSRHLTMIAIGGIIGAGLFVGSSAAIAHTGPAILISYALAGAIIFLVMRMLAEMVSASPKNRIFTECIRDGLGPWAGFMSGWLYWLAWMVTIAIEAIIAAQLIRPFVPLPIWLTGFVIISVMVATNLWSARAFGEFEVLFSAIKVGAIILFILLGAAYLSGLAPLPGAGGGLQTLWNGEGGFLPFGPVSILTGVVTVMFSMLGAEIATVAAAESSLGQRAVGRIAASLVVRILLFYVGSVAVILSIVPWSEIPVGSSPFVAALSVMRVPGAGLIMNVIVLVAVLSCLNSGLYANSRVLFILADHKDAPAGLVALNRRKVPARAILLGGAFGYLGVLASVFSPTVVFAFLVNSVGALTFFNYLLLGLAHIRTRRRLEASRAEMPVKMWLFPWLSYATLAAIVGILLLMTTSPKHAAEVIGSLSTVAVVAVTYLVRQAVRRRRAQVAVPG